MDAGNLLNKYLAINMKKNELKICLKENRYPELLEKKIKLKRGMLEKKDIIINLLNKLDFTIRRRRDKKLKNSIPLLKNAATNKAKHKKEISNTLKLKGLTNKYI